MPIPDRWDHEHIVAPAARKLVAAVRDPDTQDALFMILSLVNNLIEERNNAQH